MIDPLEGTEVPVRGRGLRSRSGDFEPGLRPLSGDSLPGVRPLPGDYRMAGSKIKGMQQLDPTIFDKLFA